MEFHDEIQHFTMTQPMNPWWIEYRQQQLKQEHRSTMSVEMMLRRSFREVLREYIDNCSISGVQSMFDPKIGWLHRFVRISIFVSLVCFFWYLLNQTWLATLANPLIVTTESTTYPIGNIDFPAVALCNTNRISKKALKAYAKQIYSQLAHKNESLQEVEDFFLQSGRLLDFSFDDRIGKISRFLDAAAGVNTRATVDAMKTLAPSCSDMLVRCAWGGNVVACDSVFSVRRTGRGHCCAFNYILDYDSATSPNNTIGEAKRQHLPGFLHGLNVVLDPMLDDYAYPVNNFEGFDVFLYDPSHYADLSAGRIIHRFAEPNRAEFLELKSIKQIASPEVKKYPINIRKCLFRDELADEFYGMYSYSACIVKCRIKTIQSLCKCTPFYLPTGKDESAVCTIENLKCLNKYKEKLMYLFPMDTNKFEGLEVEMEDSIYCPNCLPDCELTQHFTKSYKASISKLADRAYYKDEFLQDVNMTNMCVLSIHHAVGDGFLDRLDVVSYWFEVLSNVGGVGGVILGLSVFSAVEIVYFLFVRFVIVFRYKYIKYH